MFKVVELITDEHIADVVAMSRVFFAEYNAPITYDKQEVINTCTVIKKDMERDTVNIFLIYREEEPVGFILVSISGYMFSKQRCASQDLLFVRPAYRGTKAFLMLLRAYEEWARLRACVEIWAGSIDNEAFANVLPRIGYPRVGSYHRKRTI